MKRLYELGLEKHAVLDLALVYIPGEQCYLIPDSSISGALGHLFGPACCLLQILFSFVTAAASTAPSCLSAGQWFNYPDNIEGGSSEEQANAFIWKSKSLETILSGENGISESRMERGGIGSCLVLSQDSNAKRRQQQISDFTSHFASRFREGLSHTSTTHLGHRT